ncbi:MAG: hypothetical protein H0V81_12620, partial [Solirubrobacterales bacterium]|nr:hypothetical protein [Solirubrobacterales bacterium]
MPSLDDVARFHPNDDPALVAASFACPLCLGLDGSAQLVLDDGDAEVERACPCGASWCVAVDAAQVMRLTLHPPAPETCAGLRLLPV